MKKTKYLNNKETRSLMLNLWTRCFRISRLSLNIFKRLYLHRIRLIFNMVLFLFFYILAADFFNTDYE